MSGWCWGFLGRCWGYWRCRWAVELVRVVGAGWRWGWCRWCVGVRVSRPCVRGRGPGRHDEPRRARPGRYTPKGTAYPAPSMADPNACQRGDTHPAGQDQTETRRPSALPTSEGRLHAGHGRAADLARLPRRDARCSRQDGITTSLSPAARRLRVKYMGGANCGEQPIA
jgi:hypothetical protein